ncbi:DEAD/DEAH box helicase [Paenibacillus sp.]|jgi:SNF2 family DNA or RNA helicase|uniref:DEAD/DEAH box helicase n=1 Tax=Paenibacillus sp. TaxID=58172 RepID=UPI00281A415C|nr:DEAD/DEAH box helicase [Paenibacillus sp.]MDR0270797.1 DEAD/DEAH box helicase [Paenibacillus sp.]
MSSYLAFADTITVHVLLSAYGDALIYGTSSSHRSVSGLVLKQRMFAWHEASFYGTELEVRQMEDQGAGLVVLPAEQVLSFFAERELLHHISWEWDQDAEALLQLAPVLTDCARERQFIPSLVSFREGKLEWTWDRPLLEEQARQQIDRSRPEFAEGLQAAFSALVFQSCYGTDSAATDLRREYPMLFTVGAATGGLQEKEWLISIGWKADMAPFRPLLQLLEPDEGSPTWRLSLVLQDKFDPSVLVSVRLGSDGHVSGIWPDSWTHHVEERSAGWADHLRASMQAFVVAGQCDDLLDKPLSNAAAWQFLTVDSKRLLESGWQVLLPAWWEAASRKKPKLRAKVRAEEGDDKRQSGGSSLFGLDSIIQFDWRIAIGETQLTESEFQELVARNERLVRFRGEWMTLDPALIKQIRQMMEGMDRKQGLSFQDVLQLHLQKKDDWTQRGKEDQPEEDEMQESSTRIELEVELNEHLMELFNQLGQRSEWPRLAIPQGLKAELRSYQYDGFSWLAFMRRFGLGACLADDMGLGKTVQFITYLLYLKENAADEEGLPSLLICPTSVLGNWQRELMRFAPSLNVMLHYGSRRSDEESFRREIRQADIVLTSYATATLDQDILNAVTWESLCLDEAQNIKNAQTKQSSAVRSFPARHRIALTGTPIENRLSELWSLYDFMNPGYLGNLRAFSVRFIQPIEKEQDEERTQQLQKLVKPFMLRRKKKDPAIQLALPDKNEMKTYIHLTSEQGALYDQTVNELMSRVQKLEGIQRKGAILSALTHLKQICDHPLLLTGASSEYPENEDQSLDTETLLSQSAKLERLLDMVRELREEGDRCLIFTQYIGMGEMLQRVLQQELQEPVLYLNGSTSKSARDRMIDQFQSQTLPPEDQPSVFILSIKAGGVGLNLTAANHVFHFDRWWNPAVENQATDRAYRMGQTKDVQVHKFISLGTLEERIDEMLESKQQLSDNVISSTESWITELSTEALKDLFTLRSDWSGE